MTKEQLIAQLEGAKELTSVVSIDNVIALIQSIEPEVIVEKEFAMTQEFAENLTDRIARVLDCHCDDLLDLESAEFELGWDNRLELRSCNANVYTIVEHIEGTLEQFIAEEEDEVTEPEDDGCGPSEEEIMQSVNDGLGTQTEE
jgi:hypothetical protein